jgi:hypothetical protein
VERGGFELPVPVSKLSDDSIMWNLRRRDELPRSRGDSNVAQGALGEKLLLLAVARVGDDLISRELVLPRSVRGHVDNSLRIARFFPRNPSRS